MQSLTLVPTADLKGRRLALGLSQQAVAQRAPCSLSMLQLLESGYVPKRSDVVPRVIAVLNEDRGR